jgi:hypothetical protein
MTSDVELIQPSPGVLSRASFAFERVSLALGGWALPILIVLAAGAVRFIGLSHPHSLVPLDETYYAPNGYGYLCHGADMTFKAGAPHTCAGLEPAFAVHPPVGKILIAGGIKLFGYNPLGWRFAAALFGTLSVLVIYLIARRLWTSRWLAAAAATLLGVEGLQIVQSRLAMLDIFLSFFVLLGVWLLLEDRERGAGPLGVRWWRIGSGVALGLAVASKWAAGPLVPVVAAVAFAWEVARIFDRRADERAAADSSVTETASQERGELLVSPGDATPTEGEQRRNWSAPRLPAPNVGWPLRLLKLIVLTAVPLFAVYLYWPPQHGDSFWIRTGKISVMVFIALVVALYLRARRDGLFVQLVRIAGTFAIIPVLVYVGSYGTWFLSTERYIPPLCHNTVFVDGVARSVPKAGMDLWRCNQHEIWNYHQHLNSTNADGTPIHPYMSKAWSWPWISRPAAHYFQSYCDPGRTPGPCKSGQVPRDEEILGLPNPLIWWTGFFIALPMCLWWTIRRQDQVAALLVVFFAPLVLPWFVTSRPLFMFYMTPAVPFLVLMVVHAMKVWRLRATAVAYVAVAVGLFLYFYPILTAYPLPPTGPFGWEGRIWFGHGIRGDCTSKGIRLLCWI